MTSSWFRILLLLGQTILLETQQIQFSHGWTPGFGIGKRNPPIRTTYPSNILRSFGNPPPFSSPPFSSLFCRTLPFSAFFSICSATCRHSSSYSSSKSFVGRKRETYGCCCLKRSPLIWNYPRIDYQVIV